MAEKKQTKKTTAETEAAKVSENTVSEKEESVNPLQETVDTLTKEVSDTKEKLLRTMAEYDNFRKRSIKEKEAIYPDAVSKTVEKILPVIDGFERALAANSSDAEFKKGVLMIYNMFISTLAQIGVTEIDALDKPFNPDMHNAVMHIEDESAGENTVVEVLQKGYMIGDRVIRYAMVKVAN